jgi:hypothetical protein
MVPRNLTPVVLNSRRPDPACAPPSSPTPGDVSPRATVRFVGRYRVTAVPIEAYLEFLQIKTAHGDTIAAKRMRNPGASIHPASERTSVADCRSTARETACLIRMALRTESPAPLLGHTESTRCPTMSSD